MNNFEFQSIDPCIRFLQDENSNNQSELWKDPLHCHNDLKIDDEREYHESIEQIEDERGPKKTDFKEGKNTCRKKVFYRDKMATLINDEGKKKNEYQYADYSHSNRGKTPITREEQLKRNRESAKQSRQRRKEYLETLQQKNIENEKLISELTMKLRQVQIERDRLREDNRSYIKSFISSKNEAYQNLLEIAKTKNKAKIGDQVKRMNAKYGAAGSERIATTDFYIKEVIQILIGDIHKYLVYSAMNNSGLFGVGEWNHLDDKICERLKIDKGNRKNLSIKFKDKMTKQFQAFQDISQCFYDSYRSVQNQARVIERIFSELSLQFQDDQIADLLIWLEENKFHKDIKKIRAFWIHSVIQSEKVKDRVRKMTKTQ